MTWKWHFFFFFFFKIYSFLRDIESKGNQPWILIGRTDPKAEVPILWPPDKNRGLLGKDPATGKDWRQEEEGTAEKEMVGWHHQVNGHELGQTLEMVRDRGAQRAAVPGVAKSDTTIEQRDTELLENGKSSIKNQFLVAQIHTINTFCSSQSPECLWDPFCGDDTVTSAWQKNRKDNYSLLHPSAPPPARNTYYVLKL